MQPVAVAVLPMRPDEERRRRREEFESRQLLAKADAVVKLSADQLKRLDAAAALYRQRLEGRKR